MPLPNAPEAAPRAMTVTIATTATTDIKVFSDADALAAAAAQAFADAAHASIAARGRFTVALAGGSTPEKTYRLLAGAPYDREIDWTRVLVFFGDERFVAADDERSNYAMAQRTLLSTVPIPRDRIFPIDTTLPTPADSALAYGATLQGAFGTDTTPESGVPIFDLILLGLGDDGHTASLFPQADALNVNNAITTWSPPGVLPPPVDRITLTYPTLNAARAILFLIAGANKAAALADILESGAKAVDRPAAGVDPSVGTLTYLIDEAAAADLKGTKK